MPAPPPIVASALPSALAQTWPPFVLIAGLLLIGVVAASDNLFEAVGSSLARLPGGGLVLFASLMLLVAVVTVVLNLDTSVVFLTPILIHAARRRGISETAFVYGAVFMSNSASLLLPGSNLTNLLVLSGNHVSGGMFAAEMYPAWIAAVALTAAVLVAWRWRDLRSATGNEVVQAPLRAGPGLFGVVGATVLVLVLHNPAPAVAGLGVVLVMLQVLRHRIAPRDAARSVSILTLAGLFALATLLGTLARLSGAPGRLMTSVGTWATAWIGAGTSVVINNLPAAVLLSARTPAHPRALLVGLNLGPNLAISGSLSAIFWLRVARAERADPSLLTYSKVGLVLVPVSIAAALALSQLIAPAGL